MKPSTTMIKGIRKSSSSLMFFQRRHGDTISKLSSSASSFPRDNRRRPRLAHSQYHGGVGTTTTKLLDVEFTDRCIHEFDFSYCHSTRTIHRTLVTTTAAATTAPASSKNAATSAAAAVKAQITSNEELSAIIRQFPSGVDYSFGYGSMVLSQQDQQDQQQQQKQPLDSKSLLNNDETYTKEKSTNNNNNKNVSNKSMIDIILSVDNPHSWHTKNLQLHPHHYSWLSRMGGPTFVAWLQTNFGARLFFHPFVDLELDDGVTVLGNNDKSSTLSPSSTMTIDSSVPSKSTIRHQIKYGIVSTDDLISDLRNWDYLYLAGRMHKPIVSIDGTSVGNDDGGGGGGGGITNSSSRRDEIEEAQRVNLLAAVSASLLLLHTNNEKAEKRIKEQDQQDQQEQQQQQQQQKLPTSQLYNTIASLSYTGDFRMETGAEDPNKVNKLVETPGMLDLWENKYEETLRELEGLGLVSLSDDGAGKGNGERRKNDRYYLEYNLRDVAARKELVQYLPLRLRQHSDRIIGSSSSSSGGGGDSSNGSAFLRQELANIVAPAAKSQSVKGFFTAGVAKSWKYALAKFAKGQLR